jgi:DHA2 family multidrug resistance protein
VLICSLGLYRMAQFTLGIDYRTALWARVTQSTGMAFLFVPISTAAFAFIPKDRTNYAAGLFNLARNIGGSSGIASITTLLARRAQFHQYRLVEHLTPQDAGYQSAVAHTAQLLHTRGYSLPDAASRAPALLYGSVQRQASMLAFADAFWVMAVLFLAVVPLMFLMRRSAAARGLGQAG